MFPARFKQPTLLRRDPLAGDTDLLTKLGRLGEESRQGFVGLCHGPSPRGSPSAVMVVSWMFTWASTLFRAARAPWTLSRTR